MARLISIRSLRSRIASYGCDTEGYQWVPKLKNSTSNVMVTADTIIRTGEARTPAENWREILSARAVYKVGRFRFERRGRSRTAGLVSFLRSVLLCNGFKSVLLATANHAGRYFKPEPWLEPWHQIPKKDERAARLFRGLLIRPGKRCGIVCSLPSEAEKIVALARWLWSFRCRNLYLFMGRDLRVVVCHEQDLHLCSLNRSLVSKLSKLAASRGLAIAPFGIQQCN